MSMMSAASAQIAPSSMLGSKRKSLQQEQQCAELTAKKLRTNESPPQQSMHLQHGDDDETAAAALLLESLRRGSVDSERTVSDCESDAYRTRNGNGGDGGVGVGAKSSIVEEDDIFSGILPSDMRYLMPFLPSEQRVFQCAVCFLTLESLTDLSKHVQNHSSNSVLECYYCGEHYLPDELKPLFHHIIAQHSHPSGCQFACHVCGRRYLDRAGLLLCSHTKQHKPAVSKKNLKAASSSSVPMVEDEKIKSQESPEMQAFMKQFRPLGKINKKCHKCLRYFLVSSLSSHIETAHQDSMHEPGLECMFCRQVFITEDDSILIKHMIERHSKDPTPFRCTKCHDFRTSSVLCFNAHTKRYCRNR